MKQKGVFLTLVCVMLFVACGGESKKEETTAVKQERQGSPIGTWYLYAGSDSGIRTESMNEEVTILVLEDSTYTLTMMQPEKQLNFVEKGSVSYNEHSKSMDFVVFSSTGVDFGGAEPRKLVDVEQVVPWERAPGTVYKMTWSNDWQHDEEADVDREVMTLSAQDHEDSFFVRLQNRDASVPDLDAKLKSQQK